MRVPRLVRRDDERAPHPQAHLDEPRVHRRQPEQRGHRRSLLACGRVAQTENRVACSDRRLGEHGQPVERGAKAFLLGECRVEDARSQRIDTVRVEQEAWNDRQRR